MATQFEFNQSIKLFQCTQVYCSTDQFQRMEPSLAARSAFCCLLFLIYILFFILLAIFYWISALSVKIFSNQIIVSLIYSLQLIKWIIVSATLSHFTKRLSLYFNRPHSITRSSSRMHPITWLLGHTFRKTST